MRMRTRWVPVSLAVGLVAAAITGGAVLASGGGSDGNDRQDATGTYELETRVAEILGTDPQATVDAFVRADAEIETEFVDEYLRQAVADSRITQGQADAIRAQVQSGDYSGFDQLLEDVLTTACDMDVRFAEPQVVYDEMPSHQEYVARIGAILKVGGPQVADAMNQAFDEAFQDDAWATWDENDADRGGQDPWATRVAEILGTDPQATVDAFAQVDAEIEAEFAYEYLRQAVANGTITQEQADAIRIQLEAGDYSGFDQLLENLFPTACDVGVWLTELEVVFDERHSRPSYADRIGAILNVDGQQVADAIDQAIRELFLTDQESVEPVPTGPVAG